MARKVNYSKILSTWWTGVSYHIEQIEMLISLADVVSYSYILHDKDIIPETGELKKPHYHFLVKLSKNQRGSWFKMFSTDDMGIMYVEAVGDPKNMYDYLIHDTEKAKKAGKYLYDPSERIGIIDDLVADEKEKPSDTILKFLIEIVNGQKTWTELFMAKSETIYSFGNLHPAAIQIRNDMYGENVDPFEKKVKITDK